MALVNGPLFSLDASGKVGDAIVYTKWKGRNVVREYVVPANPRSLAQRSARVAMQAINMLWPLSDALDREAWEPAAAARSISPFNEMTSTNLQRPTDGAYPTVAPTDDGAAPTETVDTETLTQSGGTLTYKIDLATAAATPEFAYLLMVDGSGMTTFTATNMVAVAAIAEGATHGEVAIPAPPPGPYTWTVVRTDKYGAPTAHGVDTNITVTG